MKTKEELHSYWRNPEDGSNKPEDYLGNETTLLRSEYLYGIVSSRFKPGATILELGCNVGRNLNYLYKRGYKKLTGIEINEQAVRLMSKNYPDCYYNVEIITGSIEENIRSFKENEFDLLFVMAVLEHVHPESEWIFNEMIRISKNILVIEDERTAGWKHCARNYKKIFNSLRQVEHKRLGKKQGFYGGVRMRLFTKQRK